MRDDGRHQLYRPIGVVVQRKMLKEGYNLYLHAVEALQDRKTATTEEKNKSAQAKLNLRKLKMLLLNRLGDFSTILLDGDEVILSLLAKDSTLVALSIDRRLFFFLSAFRWNF
jgi:hypothetical protein